MPLTATVIDPLTEPVPASWDTFVAAEGLWPLWGSSPLRTISWCALAPSSMVLVGEAGSDEPVALFHARHLGPTNPTRFARPRRVPRVSVTDCRLVPGTMGAGVAFASTVDEPGRLEAVRVFERAIRRRARGVAIAYRELEGHHLPAIPTARRLRLRLGPTMVLHNEWTDLAGYLASLPGKWRSQLKRIHHDIEADETIRVQLGPTIDGADACWLNEVVRSRYLSAAIPHPPLSASYYGLLTRLPGTRFLTYHTAQGRLLAYAAVCDNGRDLLLLSWGSRGEAEGRYDNLYFDQYRRLIELMITTGRRRLFMGKGTHGIKMRYGARAEPLWCVIGPR